MSRMSDFDIQIRNMNINPEIVDLEKVQEYQEVYWQETGGILTTIEAIEHMYSYTSYQGVNIQKCTCIKQCTCFDEYQDDKYTHTARKDWERSIYEQCDREDREDMNRGIL